MDNKKVRKELKEKKNNFDIITQGAAKFMARCFFGEFLGSFSFWDELKIDSLWPQGGFLCVLCDRFCVFRRSIIFRSSTQKIIHFSTSIELLWISLQFYWDIWFRVSKQNHCYLWWASSPENYILLILFFLLYHISAPRLVFQTVITIFSKKNFIRKLSFIPKKIPFSLIFLWCIFSYYAAKQLSKANIYSSDRSFELSRNVKFIRKVYFSLNETAFYKLTGCLIFLF